VGTQVQVDLRLLAAGVSAVLRVEEGAHCRGWIDLKLKDLVGHTGRACTGRACKVRLWMDPWVEDALGGEPEYASTRASEWSMPSNSFAIESVFRPVFVRIILFISIGFHPHVWFSRLTHSHPNTHSRSHQTSFSHFSSTLRSTRTSRSNNAYPHSSSVSLTCFCRFLSHHTHHITPSTQ